MERWLRIFALVVLLGVSASAAAQKAGAVGLALWEDWSPPASSANPQLRPPGPGTIRAAFISNGGKWAAACSSKTNTCTGDAPGVFGKLFLESPGDSVPVETSGWAPRKGCCHDLGWLTHPLKAHPGKDRSTKFSNWATPVAARPIVMTTSPVPVTDPERWQTVKTTPAEMTSIRSTADQILRRQNACPGFHASKSGKPNPQRIPQGWIRIKESMRNAAGTRLILASLTEAAGKRCARDSEAELTAADDILLVSDGRAGTALREVNLSSLQPGFTLELIRVGDFDGDGTSEVLLFYAGYNRDGYVLLHSGLGRISDFLWSYH